MKCSRSEVKKLLQDVRGRVEADGGASSSMRRWLLPPEDEPSEPSQELSLPGNKSLETGPPVTVKELMDELRDIVDGPDFEVVLSERLDAGFEHLEEKISERVFPADSEGGSKETKVLAKLLAPLKDVAASLFHKEEEDRATLGGGCMLETLSRINLAASSRDFFVCIFWGGDDPDQEA